MGYIEAAQKSADIFRRNRLRIVDVTDPADLIALVAASSEESRYQRFHTGMADLRPVMAEQLTQANGRALGLRSRSGRLVAEARYTHTSGDEAEVAILVADKYQGRGLGTALMALVFQQAAADGIGTVTAEVLGSNDAMMAVFQRLAPVELMGMVEGTQHIRMPLGEVAAAA